jgi:hypothetical protein
MTLDEMKTLRRGDRVIWTNLTHSSAGVVCNRSPAGVSVQFEPGRRVYFHYASGHESALTRLTTKGT